MVPAPEIDPASGVRLIGPPTDYADGSEAAVLSVLEAAGDRSAASDELARAVTGWESRYHLSRLRANLLRPLRLGPGMRVLDAGAGTGALARYVAETGAEVVALEGSLARARAAAARCDGLDNVEVVCGPIESFADGDPGGDGFDVVLCVGVLEYAGTGAGELLGRLRRLTRPAGVLAVAIENQLGLKYLLGYGEDHLGQPWLGVEGYPGVAPGGPRTWSRRSLAARLDHAGFAAQRWLFPFPDYKLPVAVLAETAYTGPEFVDQLVRWPCTAQASAQLRVSDDRLAHRVFLDAGLGPEVANSFLVVAGAAGEDVDGVVDPGCEAWFFGNDRMRLWLNLKRFGADVAGEAVDGTGRLPESGWLRQVRERRQPRVEGPSMEQLALDALGGGAGAVGAVLRRWREHLRGLEFEAKDDGGAASPAHPFRAAGSRRLLPDDHLDVNLSNFLAAPDGSLVFVDGEWVVPGGVDADLAVARSLWWFAADLVAHGVAHPWPRSSTVDELAETLGLLCESPADAGVVERWREAEAQLHAKVTNLAVEECRRELEHLGRARQDGPGVVRHLPFTVLRRQLAASYEHLAGTCQQLETALQQVDALQRSVEAEVEMKLAFARQLEAAQAQIGDLSARLEAERSAAASVQDALDEQVRWRQAFDRRPLVRAYRYLRSIARR